MGVTIRPGDTEWMAAAACRGKSNWAFFAPGRFAREEAFKVCADCPVREECLHYAMTHNLNHPEDGIWGGMTNSQRRRMRRRQLAMERSA